MEASPDVVGQAMKMVRVLRRMERSERNESRGAVRLLNRLAQHDGLTARELAEIMDIRQSSLTEVLNRLECDGIIHRVPDQDDHRRVRIFILDQGLKIVDRARERRKKEIAYIDSVLSQEEQHSFCSLCAKISWALENRAIKEGE